MGAFTQWDANAVPMVPHSVAGQYIATEANYCPGTIEYRFSNGDPSNTSNHEPIPMDCGVDNGVGVTTVRSQEQVVWIPFNIFLVHVHSSLLKKMHYRV